VELESVDMKAEESKSGLDSGLHTGINLFIPWPLFYFGASKYVL